MLFLQVVSGSAWQQWHPRAEVINCTLTTLWMGFNTILPLKIAVKKKVDFLRLLGIIS